MSSTFPHFPVFSPIFPQIFLIFFLILVFWVGKQESPGYATDKVSLKKSYSSQYDSKLMKLQKENQAKVQMQQQNSKSSSASNALLRQVNFVTANQISKGLKA